MKVETITMDPDEASTQLRSYRRQLHKRADAEYEAVAAGLKALAEGQAILLLSKAIADAGFDDQGLPRLAIARADRRRVDFSWDWNGTARFTADGYRDARSTYNEQTLELAVAVGLTAPPAQARYVERGSTWTTLRRGQALVPMIPAAVREQVGRFRADRRFILWEAVWKRLPPVDPFLLRHLGGDAYAIEAAWDLTPLERAVMRGRAIS